MKLLICFGTRPEYIKVRSLIENMEVKTMFTGQHINLLKGVKVDYRIKIEDKTRNRLNDIVSSIMSRSDIFEEVTDVLIQGDTTSAMAVALSAFHNKCRVIHLEAGLRTHDIHDPFPEEMNRQLISRMATINLCPTEWNKENLRREGVSGKIVVVGNTGLDNIEKEGCNYGSTVLITMHRRDNHAMMKEWFQTISKIAKKYEDLEFIIPIHPNPNVMKHIDKLEGVTVIEPIPHNKLIKILKEVRFVISDSGGLQEEASYLNKKIIVCRRGTERPESMGTHSILCKYPNELEAIVEEIHNNYEIEKECPYGDGKAWKKIKDYINEK